VPKPVNEKIDNLRSEKASLDRIAKLLALLVTKGETQIEQVATLSRIGFSNIELAQLLGTSPGAVGVALFNSRKTPRKRKKKE
jgi:hypothetical protein